MELSRRSLFLGALTPPSDWVSLFDGVSARGWLEVTGLAFPAATWRVEQGCLRSVPAETGGFQDIRTTAEFTEFEFEFEWRIEPGGNSGVKYFIERTNRWPAPDGGYNARGRGAEYQIIDDASESDDGKHCGALYGRIAPRLAAANRVGEFNMSKIIVAAGRVEHWLNGELVVQYKAAARKSPIVLQHHNSTAWFRRLRVRRIESPAPAG
ncbi:MAG TPA: DUF1080 domain-containing protein [Bryobacteraceae bacterium]|nr:DUF1080 domain-containing protein [Bryobacteraceae bacterium]HPT25636.1 DUF1080 domain-containing protein [Bryobacteraceae bacterium]